MTDTNQGQDFITQPGGKPVLPGGINTLTILTFIGCAIGFITSIWQFFSAKKSLDKMEEMINSGNFDNMPSFVKSMMSPDALEMARKSYENRMPIMLLGLVSIALCLYGAAQIRKLKMQGYYLYVVGELLPFVAAIVFIGVGAFKGFGVIGILFALLFIILYTAQRKHLVK